MLKEIGLYDRKILNQSNNSIKYSSKDIDFLRLSKKYFSKIISKPIDVSVIEKSKNVIVKNFDIKWSDVGSWPSIFNLSKKDKQNNLIKGSIEIKNVKNSFIQSENQQVMVIGQKNIVIISTKDALLIMPNDKNTNIKESIKNLSKKKILKFEDNNLMQIMCGAYHSNLDVIEKQLDVSLLPRGNLISILGKSENILMYSYYLSSYVH